MSQRIINSSALDMEISTVFMSQVTCTGSEQYFNECMHSRPPTGSCERAAVSCVQNSGTKFIEVPHLVNVVIITLLRSTKL